jgi:hypothetical protein
MQFARVYYSKNGSDTQVKAVFSWRRNGGNGTIYRYEGDVRS